MSYAIAIDGPSGAGKSTLVRCMNFLEVPSEGKVLIDGKSLSEFSPKELRKEREKIGMIFQHFNLLMQKNVLENVCFPLYIQGKKKAEARAKALELLEIVGLADRAKAYPAQLSGGQKQRLSIARAIIKKPEIYIFDDSFSALDFKTDAALREELMKSCKKTGSTVLLVAQRISSILHADQIIVLDEGRMVGKGTHQELIKSCRIYQEIASSQLSKEELANV